MTLITLTEAAEMLKISQKYAQNNWKRWGKFGVNAYKPLGTHRVMFDKREIERAITASKVS